MSLIVAIALLSGPPMPSQATLEIRIHVGRNHESGVIRSELSRNDEWFLTRRYRVEANYRLKLVEDLYDSRPYCEIGRGRDRHEFRAGTFGGSGTFMESLASIAAFDHWERENPLLLGSIWAEDPEMSDWAKIQLSELQSTRPEVFPPEPPEEAPDP